MAEQPKIVTGIGKAELHRILVRGYDLNKDKTGDVPYRPLSLFSVIAEKNPPVMLLFRSFIIMLLDRSEKIIPTLTPDNFIDEKPAMKAIEL